VGTQVDTQAVEATAVEAMAAEGQAVQPAVEAKAEVVEMAMVD